MEDTDDAANDNTDTDSSTISDNGSEGSKVTEPTTHVSEDSSSKALEKHRRELEDMIRELHGADKQEREALRAELAEVKEWQKEQVKAQEDRDKIKSSTSTIVLPPSDVAPQQPAGPTHEEQKKRKLAWW